VALQAETFGAPHLRASLSRLLQCDERGQLALGFRAALELRTSKECSEITVLGSGGSGSGGSGGGGGGGGGVEMTEAGRARTFRWSVGALAPHYTTAATLKRSSEKSAPEASQFLQLSASYMHADGGRRVRVSTLRLPRLPSGVPTRQLLPAFDQQAAAALMIRQAAGEAHDGATTPELLTSIDRRLIKVMRALCAFAKGEPSSVALPPQAGMLPGLIFHLRRSPAIRTTNLSPDETAYFRHLVGTLGVFSALVLVQPTLSAYERGRQATPLQLDPSAMLPERSLLLDTFTKLILCHGAHIAQWRRSAASAKPGAQHGTSSDPELEAIVASGRKDLEALAAARFPAPEVFECDQYGSKARYLVQKLNPDVPLVEFLQGLYKAIVAS
jgi:protein transport protein SEC23